MAGFTGISFYADFSGVAEVIGNGLAMADAVEDDRYVSDLVHAAFNRVNNEFNVEAVALGQTGAIAHMFEWGTIGINRGRSNVRPDPFSERARLWETKLSGYGKSLSLGFDFKKSIGIVPKPTKRDSGMSPEIISKMRDHIFYAKAMVMETGMAVTIYPKDAKFLLIPYWKGATGFRPHDIKRGYILEKGEETLKPGANVKGNFTSFWIKFWTSRGVNFIDENIEEYITTDFGPGFLGNISSTPKPVVTNNIASEVARKRAEAKQIAKRKASSRRAGTE